MSTDDRKTTTDAEVEPSIQDLNPRELDSRSAQQTKGGATTSTGTGKVSSNEFTIKKIIDTSSP